MNERKKEREEGGRLELRPVVRPGNEGIGGREVAGRLARAPCDAMRCDATRRRVWPEEGKTGSKE